MLWRRRHPGYIYGAGGRKHGSSWAGGQDEGRAVVRLPLPRVPKRKGQRRKERVSLGPGPCALLLFVLRREIGKSSTSRTSPALTLWLDPTKAANSCQTTDLFGRKLSNNTSIPSLYVSEEYACTVRTPSADRVGLPLNENHGQSKVHVDHVQNITYATLSRAFGPFPHLFLFD